MEGILSSLVGVLSNPLVLKALFAYWLYSAFVGALPSPEVLSQHVKSWGWMLLYRTVFGFLHGLSGNLSRAAVALRVPGAQQEQPNT